VYVIFIHIGSLKRLVINVWF